MRKHQKNAGFTLIEMLTVIGVIAIISAILIPVLGGIRNRATLTEATSALREIGAAANMFVSDSGGFICPPGGQREIYPQSLNNRLGGSWSQTLTPYLSGLSIDTPFEDLPSILVCPRWDSVQASRDQNNWKETSPWLHGFGMNKWYYQNGQLNAPSLDADLMPIRMLQIDNPARQLYVTTSDTFYQSMAPWDVNGYLAKGELGPERYSNTENPYLFLDGHVELLSPEQLRNRIN